MGDAVNETPEFDFVSISVAPSASSSEERMLCRPGIHVAKYARTFSTLCMSLVLSLIIDLSCLCESSCSCNLCESSRSIIQSLLANKPYLEALEVEALTTTYEGTGNSRPCICTKQNAMKKIAEILFMCGIFDYDEIGALELSNGDCWLLGDG